jgi:hypothetical protein
MTFLLNLRSESVGVEIVQPAKDKYAGSLAEDKPIEGACFEMPPLTPEIIRTKQLDPRQSIGMFSAPAVWYHGRSKAYAQRHPR